MTTRSALYGLILVALTGAACGGDGAPLGPADAQFIDTMVALREAARAADGDAQTYATLKAGVLQAKGVTEDELRAYIQRHAQDLDRLAAVWESINVRLAAPDPQPQ